MPRRLHFCHAFGPHFCKERNKENQNSPICRHQFNLNCMREWWCFALLFGGISQEIFALPRGKLSCHAWLLPTQGKHVGQKMHEEGRLKRFYWQEGRAHCHPSLGGSLHSRTRERAAQLTIHAESDIRRPAGMFYSYLFSCDRDNSYIHQQSISTIHLDAATLPGYGRGVLIHFPQR